MPYRLDIPGWMREPDLRCIETLAYRVPENGHVIEVGSFYGRSSWAWSKSIPDSATLHCIDPWDDQAILEYGINAMDGDVPEQRPIKVDLWTFLRYTNDCENIIFTRDYSANVLPKLQHGSYDLVFLDGFHENPGFHDDLHMSLPLLKSGGILSGHDFTPRFTHSIMAEVIDLARTLNVEVRLAENGCIWYFEVP